MFFIYSLNIEDYNIQLYDFCRTKDGITELLDTVARNFIRREEGERAAEAPYRDDITNDKLTDNGYFLRHSGEKPYQIDVYQRKTNVEVGRVWNSYEITCKKVMHFSVTEASLGLPIECTGKGVTTKTFNNAKESHEQADHINALKMRLVSQREKVDKQLVDGYAIFEIKPKKTVEYTGNPLIRLRKMVEADSEFASVNKLLDELINMPSDASIVRPPTPPPLPQVFKPKGKNTAEESTDDSSDDSSDDVDDDSSIDSSDTSEEWDIKSDDESECDGWSNDSDNE